MQPQKYVEAEERAIRQMNKERQKNCKAGRFEVKNTKNDYNKNEFTFEVVNHGCQNARRNGSAWCQECSDKHIVSQ